MVEEAWAVVCLGIVMVVLACRTVPSARSRWASSAAVVVLVLVLVVVEVAS